jgi:hypothetical protein
VYYRKGCFGNQKCQIENMRTGKPVTYCYHELYG